MHAYLQVLPSPGAHHSTMGKAMPWVGLVLLVVLAGLMQNGAGDVAARRVLRCVMQLAADLPAAILKPWLPSMRRT